MNSVMYRPRKAVFSIPMDSASHLPLLNDKAVTSAGDQHNYASTNRMKQSINDKARLAAAQGLPSRKALSNITALKNGKMNQQANKENVAPAGQEGKERNAAKNKLGKLNVFKDPSASPALSKSGSMSSVRMLGSTHASDLVRDMTNEPYEKCMVKEPNEDKSKLIRLKTAPTVLQDKPMTPTKLKIITETLQRANQRCKDLTESPLAEITAAFAAVAVRRQAQNDKFLPLPNLQSTIKLQLWMGCNANTSLPNRLRSVAGANPHFDAVGATFMI